MSTIAVASQLPDVSAQQSILAEAKSAAEFMAEYMKSMKNAVANSKNHVVQEKFEENKGKLKNTFSKLINILEGATGEVIEFAESSEKIEYALSSIEPTVSLGALPTERISYQVVKTQIDDLGKKLVENVSDVISKAKSADQLRQYAVKIGDICESLKSAVCHASGVVEDHKVSDSLITSSRELMATSIKLVEAMRIASTKTAADLSARSKLTQAARDVSLNVSGLITIAKEGARGITVCQEAMWSINDYISDLDSVAIFAEAGQLDPMDQKDNFRNYKDSILTSAKSLTENIKGFITTVTGTQEELAHLVTTTVASLVVLKNETKKGASSITSADKNMQIQLLSATKNVCESLQGLISAAIGASGRSPSDPAMGEFGNAIKIQFGSMAELVRLIKLLADESSRGARALEGAIEEIDASLQEIQSEAPAHGTALPEEVVLIAKQLASGVASLVSASYGKEEDLVATSSVIKNKISELVRSGKATVENAPREQQLIMTASIARACKSTQEILETLRESSNSSQSLNQNDNFRDRVQHIAAEIANAITTVVGTANSLVEEGYVDQNDPDVKAERELLQAASSIEEAAKTLTVLRFEDSQAKEASIVPLTESQKFEGQIVEAAQSITTAMGSVIKAATAVQRENVTKGKISSSTAKTAYFSDGTWNEGLISGARLVANAIKDLTEAANEAVNGNVERERVIIAAKAVSASTAKLISASVAQSDVYSQTQVRLKAAGQSIKNAANQLVKATEESIAFEEPVAVDEGASVPEGKKTTAARVQEMEAQMSILKMEKELEKARMKLAAVRKGKYDSNLAEKAASADNRKSMKRQSSIMMSKNRTS